MYLDLMDVMRAPGNVSEKPINIAPRTIDDLDFVEPIVGTVRASNARQNIVVSGKAKTAVTMECARCLQPYTQPIEMELEAVAPLSFFKALMTGAPNEEAGETDNELTDDELAVLFEGHSLDVLELIRQAAVLHAPLKPLCSEDCPGLPEANQYMDAGDDSRWHALKNWKDNHGSA